MKNKFHLYEGIIKNRYSDLRGRDWIRRISEEDRKALSGLGLEAADHGVLGGLAIVEKYGRAYMGALRWDRSRAQEIRSQHAEK